MRIVLTLMVAVLALGVLAGLGWWAFIRSVETPDFHLERADGRFELRRYSGWVAAEVKREGGRAEAVRAGFGPLARYIFARERDGERIAMTAPVLQERGAEPSSWTVRFVMPSKYARDTLPDPADEQVRLTEAPGRWMAAVRFSGWADDADFARAEEALRSWLTEQGLEAVGSAILAYYDDPWVPGPLRHNEVLIPVAPPGGAEDAS